MKKLKGFLKLPKDLLFNPEISNSGLRVYLCLVWMAKNGVAEVSHRKLRFLTRTSQVTLIKALNQLREASYLEWQSGWCFRDDGIYKANTYFLTDPCHKKKEWLSPQRQAPKQPMASGKTYVVKNTVQPTTTSASASLREKIARKKAQESNYE